MQGLVEYILNDMDIHYVCRDKYILTHNPFTKDEVKSASIYYNNGDLVIYNGVVNDKSRLKLKEWCLLLGYGNEYVNYMLDKNNILVTDFNKLKNLVTKKLLDETYDKRKLFELREINSSLYLTDSEMVNLSSAKPITSKYSETTERKKSKIEEFELSDSDSKKVIAYMNNRMVEQSHNCYPVGIRINDLFDLKAICFEYPNGFKKYRLIDSNLRYLALGTFEELYEVRVNDTNIAILNEGELDCISLKGVTDCDLYALHNVNSIKISEKFNKYEKIIVFIDNDKYEEVKVKIEKDIKEYYKGNIYILPKFYSDDKTIDFNSCLVNHGEKILKKYLTKHLTKHGVCDIL